MTGSRLSRWQIEVTEYNLTLRHISGAQNRVADALSRIVQHGTESDEIPIINTLHFQLENDINNELLPSKIMELKNETISLIKENVIDKQKTVNTILHCKTHVETHSHRKQAIDINNIEIHPLAMSIITSTNSAGQFKCSKASVLDSAVHCAPGKAIYPVCTKNEATILDSAVHCAPGKAIYQVCAKGTTNLNSAVHCAPGKAIYQLCTKK